MSELERYEANGPDERFALLREEVAKLLREVPGGLSSVSAKIGDCALDLSWVVAQPTVQAGFAMSTTVTEQVVVVNPPEDEGHQPLVAPMVGTFYHALEPGAAPFVEVGDRVMAGDPVGIIEAMKLMNRIEAEASGVVTKILVGNGEAVEFHQPLLLIKPDEA